MVCSSGVCGGVACCPGTPTQLTGTLPFVVDSEFIPAGFFGDYSALMLRSDTAGTACGGRAVSGAQGNCYKVTYAAPAAPTPSTGVDWQSNLQPMAGGAYYVNFGTAPGVIPPAGATQASFWAKGALGGEIVAFGIGSAATVPCKDSVTPPPLTVTLTAVWTQYTIPFQGQSYSGGQIAGFGFAINGVTAGTNTSFYIDNILWTQ
jgi:hypothetical protein